MREAILEVVIGRPDILQYVVTFSMLMLTRLTSFHTKLWYAAGDFMTARIESKTLVSSPCDDRGVLILMVYTGNIDPRH